MPSQILSTSASSRPGIQAGFRSRTEARASTYRFGSFELRGALLVSGSARFGERVELLSSGVRVDLGLKSRQVLMHLVRNRLRTVARDELFRTLWPDVLVSEGSLTQAIWELRRALGDCRRNARFIETKHGRGYRFVAAVESPSEWGAFSSSLG
jgi:DNA-binding winged helix-turn-helix (wHTH) protein